MKTILRIFIPLIFIILLVFFLNSLLLESAGNTSTPEIFIVPQNKEGFDVIKSLNEQKLIKNIKAFTFIFNTFYIGKKIKEGGYKLNQKMTALEVIKKIIGKPDLIWVTISYCQRRKQIGETLAEKLGWSSETLSQWDNAFQNNPDYFEGVYYPDTYLLPIDETGVQIAQRFVDRFNEKFAPLADKFVEKNILWTTGLKIASLIAREAAGAEDMNLISGIIWNRLDKGMKLEIDATMQYTLGKNASGSWWGKIDLKQKQNDSPYNSYLYKGLPPTPICSPNIQFMEAVLNPVETDCFYYLHGKDKQIHCAKTYKEHLVNIEKYL